MEIIPDAVSEFEKAMAMSYPENIHIAPSSGSYILAAPLPQCLLSLGGSDRAVPVGANHSTMTF